MADGKPAKVWHDKQANPLTPRHIQELWTLVGLLLTVHSADERLRLPAAKVVRPAHPAKARPVVQPQTVRYE